MVHFVVLLESTWSCYVLNWFDGDFPIGPTPVWCLADAPPALLQGLWATPIDHCWIGASHDQSTVCTNHPICIVYGIIFLHTICFFALYPDPCGPTPWINLFQYTALHFPPWTVQALNQDGPFNAFHLPIGMNSIFVHINIKTLGFFFNGSVALKVYGLMRKDMAAIPYLTGDIVMPSIIGHLCTPFFFLHFSLACFVNPNLTLCLER